MARPLRIQQAGLTYHVTSRGNGRMTIFRDDTDRRRFLRLLGDTAEEHAVACPAYCLMGNHYHLVLRTERANLAQAIRSLNGDYAQWWNRRHRHVGHVFQGRYNAQILQDGSYFLSACRYVVLNPVRARIVRQPQHWPWSSYRATAGMVRAPSFLRLELLLAQFGDGLDATARRRYCAFVAGPEDADLGPAFDCRIVGDSTFVARFACWQQQASLEVPRAERVQGRFPTGALLNGSVSRSERDFEIADAFRQGHTRADIARHVGLHYATVGKILKRYREAARTAKRPPLASLGSDLASGKTLESKT
jgi:putative transposase